MMQYGDAAFLRLGDVDEHLALAGTRGAKLRDRDLLLERRLDQFIFQFVVNRRRGSARPTFRLRRFTLGGPAATAPTASARLAPVVSRHLTRRLPRTGRRRPARLDQIDAFLLRAFSGLIEPFGSIALCRNFMGNDDDFFLGPIVLVAIPPTPARRPAAR
ncbi:MAG: hypothetical protein IT449_03445 [Phycisphaerales bacterium]|nr:hypothetical protein [Phycisphaerales bacterium]